MSYETSIEELIKKRYSCRSYTTEVVDEGRRRTLENFIVENSTGPFGNTTRFKFITATEGERSSLKGLGTYGMIKSPTAFLIGAITTAQMSYVDFGYTMEKIILRATDLNIGSCWLGGTFKRSSFAQRIDITNEEIMPAVASMGNIAPRRTLREGLSRRVAKSDHRRPWEEIFFDTDPATPLNEASLSEEEKKILQLTRLAPSASNKQPWRILKDGKNFHFFLKRSVKYQEQLEKMNLEDLQMVDMGIALCHFELAASENNLPGAWSRENPAINFPEGEFIATWKV